MLGDCVDCGVSLLGRVAVYQDGDLRCPEDADAFDAFCEAPTEEIELTYMDSEECEGVITDASFMETYWNNLAKEHM